MKKSNKNFWQLKEVYLFFNVIEIKVRSDYDQAEYMDWNWRKILQDLSWDGEEP